MQLALIGKGGSMKKILSRLTLVMMLFLTNPCALIGASPVAPPPVEGVLPDFTLTVPEAIPSRQYLGLDAKGSFKIPDIDASVVIIEIFSMY